MNERRAGSSRFHVGDGAHGPPCACPKRVEGQHGIHTLIHLLHRLCPDRDIRPAGNDLQNNQHLCTLSYSLIQEYQMSTAMSVRLPSALAKELAHIAKETDRPRSFHVQRAIQTYIEDFADAQIALDRLRDHKDLVISSRDLRKNLGL